MHTRVRMCTCVCVCVDGLVFRQFTVRMYFKNFEEVHDSMFEL